MSARSRPQPLMGDPWLEVRTLIPAADLNFDFAVNTMTFSARRIAAAR